MILFVLTSMLNSNVVGTKPPFQFAVNENSPPVSIGRINSSPNGVLVFTRSLDQLYVKIDLLTGQISTQLPLDREITPYIRFFVVNKTVGELLAEILITIVDQNDNHPEFIASVQYLTISESADVGDSFGFRLLRDVDSGQNGVISKVTFKDPSKVTQFSIHFRSNSEAFYLILKEKLDREKQSHLLLEIVAEDSGEPALFSYSTINITVSDINDCAPKFDNTRMRLNVPESTEVNESFISLNVSDEDEGTNGKLVYTLSGTGNHFFRVTDDGVVYLAHQLTYEEMSSFDLTVNVRDCGFPPLSSHAMLQITVTDSNNHPPSIHTNDIVTVAEHNEKDKPLTFISIRDSDSRTTNGKFSLKLMNNQMTFEVKPYWLKQDNKFSQTDYYLVVKVTLDYKQQSSYEVNLQASDNLFKTNHTIVVKVTNVNDYPPVFSQQAYNVQISVLSPVGSYITTVRASDADSVQHGVVYYTFIKSTFSSFFKITNASDGTAVITLHESLAVENANLLPNILKLNISAVDNGSPQRQAFASVVIHLQDMERVCKPKITNSPSVLEITEDKAMSTVLTRYSSTCDHFRNTVLYTLQQNYTEILFTLNDGNDSGGSELYLRQKPPMNNTITNTQYVQLKIIAFNVYNSTLQSFVVTNVRFIPSSTLSANSFGFKRSFSLIPLPKGILPKDFITKIAVISSGIRVVYTVDGADKDFVRIDDKGRLYLLKSVPKNECKAFTVVATKYSSSSVIRNSTTDVLLTTTSEEESRYNYQKTRAFLRSTYSFTVVENSPIGSVVGKIELNKPVTNVKFYVDFGVESEAFTIDMNGILQSKIKLNNPSTYSFKVIAVVNCTLYKTFIYIRIKDLNNNAPYFTSTNYALISPRPYIHPVFNATAQDRDFGFNGQFTFKLLSNGNGRFCIDEKRGHIYLTQRIEASEGEHFRLKLMVSDQGIPARYSTMDLVLVMNTTVLVKKELVYYTHADIGYNPIFRIPTEDVHSKYTLSSHQNMFGLYPNGVLYMKTQQFLLQKHVHKLQIQTNGRIDNQNVSIYVTTDSEEPRKIFTNTTYTFAVNESIPLGSNIGQLSLLSEPQSVIFMSQANDYIKLSKNNMLKTKAFIDCQYLRDTNCYIRFLITGVVGGIIESCIVIIKVTDQNNHPPRFLSKHVSYNAYDNIQNIPADVLRLTDDDLKPSVRYSTKTNIHSGFFKINEATGEINVLKPLENKAYILEITALDPFNDSWSDTLFITVYNFNKPNFINLQSANLTLNISEGYLVGSIIYRYENVDKVIGGLHFSLNASSPFVIHPSTGVVELVKQLDYEQQIIHYLEISVAAENATAVVQITIRVLNENDNAPTVNSLESVNLSVRDDVSVGTVIFSCDAIDQDNDILLYTMDLEKSHFENFLSITRKNCSIKITKGLTALESSNLLLEIRISDGVHFVHTIIHLRVERVSIPRVISPSACLVPDNIPSGKILYTMNVIEAYTKEGVAYTLDDGKKHLLAH